MSIKDEGALTFPGKLKGDPNKRPRDKYCRFHRDHGHDTARKVAEVCKEGANRSTPGTNPPTRRRKSQITCRRHTDDCRGITSLGLSKKARKTYLWMVQSVRLTGSSPKMAQLDNPIIGFSEEDARHLHHPPDDALVVSIRAGDYNMHRVLVDNGSSANILYYPAFQQMGIGRERLVPTNASLVGFGGTTVYPLGVVTLFVMVGDYPQQITKDVVFLVVDCSSTYNAILGRPTLNAWKTVTSTYHLMVKFLTEYGVGKLRENQVAARECYVAMMEMDDHLQAMNIEE
ncbi:uncharacterized protein LOC142644236 [Castanea sativa]|uniref:uncharacterized protein LOC142644236 n=1 Tax=Castanea sativa TaxID=21020 RepID=UPI003F6514A9